MKNPYKAFLSTWLSASFLISIVYFLMYYPKFWLAGFYFTELSIFLASLLFLAIDLFATYIKKR